MIREAGCAAVCVLVASVVVSGCGGTVDGDSDAERSQASKQLRVDASSAADCVAEANQRNRVAVDKWQFDVANDGPAKGPYGREVRRLKAMLGSCQRKWSGDYALASAAASMSLILGDWKQATVEFGRVVAIAPQAKRADAYYGLGLAASNAEDYPAAIAAWTSFLKAPGAAADSRSAQIRAAIPALKAVQKG